jgi:hypothetical protein
MQVLVHLCFVLPAPACYIYRDMRPTTMQRVLAQRAQLEKQLRVHLAELVFAQQQLQVWVKQVRRAQGLGCWRERGRSAAESGCESGSRLVVGAPVCTRQHHVSTALHAQVTSQRPGSRPVNPDALAELQQQLLNLKAALGRSRHALHSLQDKAAAYSDADYVQYSQQCNVVLAAMEELADAYRSQGLPLAAQLQAVQEATARRVLFATTEAAVAALQAATAVHVQQLLQQRQPGWDAACAQTQQLRQRMQREMAWRYPPREHIVWRFKGRPRGFGGSSARPPLWGYASGLKQQRPPAVRQARVPRALGEGGQQQQQPGVGASARSPSH